MTKKKSSIEKLIQPIHFQNLEIKVSDDEIIQCKVYQDISLEKREHMVRGIYEMVILGDEDSYDVENYKPFLRTLARGYNILTYFTDLELPTDFKKASALILNSDLVEMVLNKMSDRTRHLIDNIIGESEDLIEVYIRTAIASRNYRVIVDKISDITDGLTEKFKDIDINEVKGILSKLKDVDSENVIKTIIDKLPQDKQNG